MLNEKKLRETCFITYVYHQMSEMKRQPTMNPKRGIKKQKQNKINKQTNKKNQDFLLNPFYC
jgi:hypothetical protein